MRFAGAVALMFSLSVGLAVAEDRLTLKDGQVVTGKIIAVTATDVQIKTTEETMRVPVWAIDKMERDGRLVDPSGRSVGKKPNRKKQKRKPPPPPPVRSPEATEPLLEWIDVCIAALGSDDLGVRNAATAAVMSTGTAARPALEKAVADNNPVVARDAKRMLSRIEHIEARAEERRLATMTRTDRMVESLGLDKQEATSFESILTEFQRKQRDVALSMRRGTVDVSDGPKRMAALDTERDKKLAKLLTDAQMSNYLTNWATPQRGQ